MRHNSRNTIVINSLPSISLKDLRDMGLISRGNHPSITVTTSAGITLHLSTVGGNRFINFYYTIDGEERHTRMRLTQVRSTIGAVNYFYCNTARVRCRRVYLIAGTIVARKAIKNGYYHLDTLSKNQRSTFLYIRRINHYQEIIAASNKRHRKRTYAGARTKLQAQIIRAQIELKSLTI